jgi:hypothetical protein
LETIQEIQYKTWWFKNCGKDIHHTEVVSLLKPKYDVSLVKFDLDSIRPLIGDISSEIGKNTSTTGKFILILGQNAICVVCGDEVATKVQDSLEMQAQSSLPILIKIIPEILPFFWVLSHSLLMIVKDAQHEM